MVLECSVVSFTFSFAANRIIRARSYGKSGGKQYLPHASTLEEIWKWHANHVKIASKTTLAAGVHFLVTMPCTELNTRHVRAQHKGEEPSTEREDVPVWIMSDVLIAYSSHASSMGMCID